MPNIDAVRRDPDELQPGVAPSEDFIAALFASLDESDSEPDDSGGGDHLIDLADGAEPRFLIRVDGSVRVE